MSVEQLTLSVGGSLVGAVVGGLLTLMGVKWTLSSQQGMERKRRALDEAAAFAGEAALAFESLNRVFLNANHPEPITGVARDTAEQRLAGLDARLATVRVFAPAAASLGERVVGSVASAMGDLILADWADPPHEQWRGRTDAYTTARDALTERIQEEYLGA